MDWTFFMLTFEKLTVSFHQDLLKNLMAHLLSFNNGKKTFIF